MPPTFSPAFQTLAVGQFPMARHSTMRGPNPGVKRHGRKAEARVPFGGTWVYIGLYTEWYAGVLSRLARPYARELAGLRTSGARRRFLIGVGISA